MKTTYSVSFRLRDGRVETRAFETMLLRLMFVVGLEGNDLGVAIAEWTS